MPPELKTRHPRDTRPFGTADYHVETAIGDEQLTAILEYLADEQWIPMAPIAITHVDNGDAIVVMWKIIAWRSHDLRDEAVEKKEASNDRRVNRSRHQEVAANLFDAPVLDTILNSAAASLIAPTQMHNDGTVDYPHYAKQPDGTHALAFCPGWIMPHPTIGIQGLCEICGAGWLSAEKREE